MVELSIIVDRLRDLSAVGQVAGVVWVVSMIAVPILRWTLGVGAERIGISIGVLTQAAFVAALILDALPYPGSLLVIGMVPVLGWLFELVGSRTGFPFGPYEYTDVLKPQIGRVPLVVPLAWLMMIPPAAAVGRLLLPGASVIVQLLVSAAAFAAWDLFLDPQMVLWRFWEWKRKGVYFGIPAINFLGWFACGFVALAAVTVLLRQSVCFLPVWPLFAVYVLTWLFQTVAQLAFWRLYGPGVTGFLVMGAFVWAVLLT